MKNIILTLIICLYVQICVYSQSGWQWINPYPTDQTIYSMSFINANTGMAVTSYGGTILWTTNGGTNWDSYVPFSKNYFSCLMINENIGLTGDYSDYYPIGIYRTIDKGKTWQQVFNTGAPGGITEFSKFGDNLVYAINEFSFLKSTNSGISWTATTISSYPNYMKSVQFINENTGFICGQTNLIYKTTNGGNNWFSIYVSGESFAFRSVMFKNENTGFVTSTQNGSLRTTNGGNNWTLYPNQNGGGAFWGDYINVIDAYSTNFGLTWTQRDTVGYFCNFADSNTCYSVYSDINKIWKSTNKGVNWFSISKNYFNESVDFKISSRTTSYVVSSNKIYKTTNSGDSFSQIYYNNQYNFKAIDFSDSLKGIIAGSEGKTLLTTNGGNNWFSKLIGTSGLLRVKYLNNKIIILDSAINKIYLSINSGNSWDTISISNDQSRLMEFVNENTGYIVTYAPSIYKTTNGGYNWNYIADFGGNSIDFYDENTGIVSGIFRYRRTFNGGASWDTLYYPNYPFQFASNSVKFVAPQTIFTTGGFGRILKSTNGGLNWNEQDCYAYNGCEATKIDFIDSLYGYVISNRGLRRTKSGGEINVGIQLISTEIPKSFFLSQNYPNPFNSRTNIKFKVSKAGSIKIDLYDILGRKIRTLINEFKRIGEYVISFEASGLSSGVYFYTMIAGDYLSTKKLVILN